MCEYSSYSNLYSHIFTSEYLAFHAVHHNTAKGLVGISPSGAVSFVSELMDHISWRHTNMPPSAVRKV